MSKYDEIIMEWMSGRLTRSDFLRSMLFSRGRQIKRQNKFKKSLIKLTPEAAVNPDLARLIETEIGGITIVI